MLYIKMNEANHLGNDIYWLKICTKKGGGHLESFNLYGLIVGWYNKIIKLRGGEIMKDELKKSDVQGVSGGYLDPEIDESSPFYNPNYIVNPFYSPENNAPLYVLRPDLPRD